MGKPLSWKEIQEKYKGYIDDDGFYVLEDENGNPKGSFFDIYGYYFDEDGYDEFGGYYDGHDYVPGDYYFDEYYMNYGHYPDEKLLDIEEEEEVKIPKIDNEELEVKYQHVIPAV